MLFTSADLRISGPIPSGMKEFVKNARGKLTNRRFDSLPSIVIEHFKLTVANYKPEQFQISVSFCGKNYFRSHNESKF